jgi:hypothetical protein
LDMGMDTCLAVVEGEEEGEDEEVAELHIRS